MLRLDTQLSLRRHEQLAYFEYISEPVLSYFYQYLYSCLRVLLFQKSTMNISTSKKNKMLISGINIWLLRSWVRTAAHQNNIMNMSAWNSNFGQKKQLLICNCNCVIKKKGGQRVPEVITTSGKFTSLLLFCGFVNLPDGNLNRLDVEDHTLRHSE